MCRTTMNDHTIQLKLMVLTIIDQMCQSFLQPKLKEGVQFYSVHHLKVKGKSVQCENQNVREMFESCAQIHVLVRLTNVAENLILT